MYGKVNIVSVIVLVLVMITSCRSSIILTSFTVTPPTIDNTGNQIPSVTISFNIDGAANVTYATISLCSSNTIINATRDAMVFDYIANLTSVSICLPLDQIPNKCDATDQNPTVSVPFNSVQVFDANLYLLLDVTNTQLTTLFPSTSSLSITYDVTPPTFNNIEYRNDTKSIYLKVNVTDSQSGVELVKVLISYVNALQQSIDVNVTLNQVPDQDSNYYGELNFNSRDSNGVNYYIQNVYVQDYANNSFTTVFNTPKIITPSNSNIVIASLPIILNQTVTPSAIVDPTIYNIVKYTLILSQTQIPFERVKVEVPNFPISCSVAINSITNLTVYCVVQANSIKSTLYPILYLYNSYNQSQIQLNGFSNPNAQLPTSTLLTKITSSKWLVPIVSQKPVFNQQLNITFTSVAKSNLDSVFYGFLTPSMYYIDQIVEGDNANGTLSIRFPFDVNAITASNAQALVYNGAASVSYAGLSTLTQSPRIDPVPSLSVNSFKLPNKTIDLTGSAQISVVPSIIGLKTNYAVNSFKLVGNNNQFTTSDMGYTHPNGLIGGDKLNGVYQSNVYHQLHTSFVRSGYFNFQLLTSDITIPLYGSCARVNYFSNVNYRVPTIKDFIISPAIVDTISSSSSQRSVTFIIVIDSSSNAIPIQSIDVVVGLYFTQTCLQSSSSSTTTTFSCSKVFYPNSKSFKEDAIQLKLNHVGGYITTSSSILEFNGFSRSLTVIGKSLSELRLNPIDLSVFQYDNATTTLSFSLATTTGSPLQSVELVMTNYVRDLPAYKQSIYYQDNISKGPIQPLYQLLNQNVNLTLPCLSSSLKTVGPFYQISIQIKDINGVVYDLPFGNILDRFPGLSLTPPKCTDNSPPILNSFVISGGGGQRSTSTQGVNLSIQFRITDNYEGVKNFTFKVRTNTGNLEWTQFYSNPARGQNTNQMYTFTKFIDAKTNTELTFSIENIYDWAENVITYTGNDISVIFNFPVPHMSLVSNTLNQAPVLTSIVYPNVVMEGESLAMTLVTVGLYKEVYVDFYGPSSNSVDRVEAVLDTAGNFSAAYSPSFGFGVYYFTITVVGNGNQINIYTSDVLASMGQGQTFTYLQNTISNPTPTSISTVVSPSLLAKSTITITNLKQGDTVSCITIDQSNPTTVYTANMQNNQCQVTIQNVQVGQTKSFSISVWINPTPSSSTTKSRLFTPIELEKAYGLNPYFNVTLTSSTSSTSTSSTTSSSSSSSSTSSTSSSTTSIPSHSHHLSPSTNIKYLCILFIFLSSFLISL